MSENRIIKIPASRWNALLKDTFDEVFNSDLPDPAYADIYGEYENNQLKGFINVETIKLVGQIYVSPEAENNRQTARNLVNYLVDTLPEGISVGAIASETRFEGLYRMLKMSMVPGKFFRRNL